MNELRLIVQQEEQAAAVAQAVVALRKLQSCDELPRHALRAAEAVEDLLAHYCDPRAALSVVGGAS